MSESIFSIHPAALVQIYDFLASRTFSDELFGMMSVNVSECNHQQVEANALC